MGEFLRFEDQLVKLLTDLEFVSKSHDEIFDTDVREELAEAIYRGFVIRETGYELPDSFAMFSDEADLAVRSALSEFLESAIRVAELANWTSQQRQDAFQNIELTSNGGLSYDDFFGHADDL